MAVIERLSAKIESGQSFTDAEVGELSEWFDRNEDQRDAIDWMLMGGDDARTWAKRLTNDGSPDDDKRSKAQGSGVDAGDPGDTQAGADADKGGAKACKDQGAGDACQCCKTYTPDEPEGDDIAEAVKQYGPDAAYMPITFKGYPGWKSADADDTAREGEPETPINRMTRLMADAFKEQEAAVLAAMKGMKAKRRNKDINDPEDRLALIEAAKNDPRVLRILEALSPDPLAQAAADGLPPMFSAGAQSGADSIGLEVSFDVSNPLVERAARERSIQLAGDLNQTTINRLRDSLADGIASGETTAKLTQRVREQFASFNDNRAEAIARTESAMAYETGQQKAWKESGVVEGKQWLLAPGACPYCNAIAKEFEGKQIGLGDVFVPKGSTVVGTNGKTMKVDYRDLDGPPGHVNCRCDLLPVLGGEFKSLDEAIKKNDTKAIKKFWTDRRAHHQDVTDDDRNT